MMEFFDQIIQWIEQFMEWFLGTPLPYDTADAFYKIIENATIILVPLLKEWIDVFAGKVT